MPKYLLYSKLWINKFSFFSLFLYFCRPLLDPKHWLKETLPMLGFTQTRESLTSSFPLLLDPTTLYVPAECTLLTCPHFSNCGVFVSFLIVKICPLHQVQYSSSVTSLQDAPSHSAHSRKKPMTFCRFSSFEFLCTPILHLCYVSRDRV